MNNMLKYKDYWGSAEFSAGDNVFYGKVQGVESLISYEGASVEELIADFHGAVDDYLSSCRERGIEPEKSWKGPLRVALPPELQKRAAAEALSRHMSLEDFMEHSIEQALERPSAK